MSKLTDAEFYEIIYRLAPLFEKRFPDKESYDYKGYHEAMDYLNAGEIVLGWAAIIYHLKEVKAVLSDVEKKEVLAVAETILSKVPDDRDALHALEDTKTLIGRSGSN
jgi:hypothetical protein